MHVVGIVGASGSGKTTLISALVPIFKRRGLRVSTIKHAHHGFDMDRPGKDSYIHRKAGAEEVMVASAGRWALLREENTDGIPPLSLLLDRMQPVDVVLVEGFKQEAIPKIEIHRPSLGKPAFYPGDSGIIAVASDEAVATSGRVRLPLNTPPQIADFILSLRRQIAA